MKRSALVDYDSSDEEEISVEQPAKKKKLPSLSADFHGQTHVDNPFLHQGRVRSSPHVEGQFSAHVYVSLNLSRHSTLHNIINDAVQYAKERVPSLNTFWDETNENKRRELHISLSRPIYLRAHQRDDLKKALRLIAREHAPLALSFATFSELDNDEGTRTFLAIEVGAGHSQLTKLSEALTPTLQFIRQNEYYATPRFHSSFAWALLDRGQEKSGLSAKPETLPVDSKSLRFPKIAHFPRDLIPTLNERLSSNLSSSRVGSFEINSIDVKIGKEISTWLLCGSK